MTKTVTKYENAVFASATMPRGNINTWRTFYVILPSCKMFTERRRLEVAQTLFELMGGDMERWEAASQEEKLRWALVHMGKYSYVTVTEYDDGTWGYENNAGGGGNYPLDQLKVMEVSK